MLTHGTPSCSMILLATVVFPEALPPHKPDIQDCYGQIYKNVALGKKDAYGFIIKQPLVI